MSGFEISEIGLLAGIIAMAILIGVLIGVSVAWAMIRIDRRARCKNHTPKP
jgi:hypothetical protein